MPGFPCPGREGAAVRAAASASPTARSLAMSRHHGNVWGKHRLSGETEARTQGRGSGDSLCHPCPCCHPRRGWQGQAEGGGCVAGGIPAEGKAAGEGRGGGGSAGLPKSTPGGANTRPAARCSQGNTAQLEHNRPLPPQKAPPGPPRSPASSRGGCAHRPLPQCPSRAYPRLPHPIPCPGSAHPARGAGEAQGPRPCRGPGRWQEPAEGSEEQPGSPRRDIPLPSPEWGWDTASTPGIPPGTAVPDTLLLQARSAGRDRAWQGGTPWPCALPGGVTDLSPLLCPDVLAGRGSSAAEGTEGLGSVWQCQGRCPVPAAAPQRLWGRRDPSGAEHGGGGRWLPAVPPMPGIRCWLCAPRARHSLLARLRDTGKRRGKLPPLSRGKTDGEPAWLQPWARVNPRHGVAARGREGLQGGPALPGWDQGAVLGPGSSGGRWASLPGEGSTAWTGRTRMLQPCLDCPHPQGMPWKCQGVPSSGGRGALTEPRGSPCSWRGDGADQGRCWESRSSCDVCEEQRLHKGTSEVPGPGLAPAQPQRSCQM